MKNSLCETHFIVPCLHSKFLSAISYIYHLSIFCIKIHIYWNHKLFWNIPKMSPLYHKLKACIPQSRYSTPLIWNTIELFIPCFNLGFPQICELAGRFSENSDFLSKEYFFLKIQSVVLLLLFLKPYQNSYHFLFSSS